MIKAPWNDMYVYDVRERSIDEAMDVLDKNGLSVKVDMSVRFHPMYNKIGYLHEFLYQRIQILSRRLRRKVKGSGKRKKLILRPSRNSSCPKCAPQCAG